MNLLGETRPDLPFQICNKFKPTLLDGRLCYSLNLSLIMIQNSQVGESAGLMILIDQGITNIRAIQDQSFHGIEDKLNNMNLDGFEDDNHSGFIIHINTLSSFRGNKGGSYGMFALKKMTGTDSFLAQNDQQKKCRIETLEDCQAKTYLINVQERCGCIPWALSRALNKQVVG